MSDWREREAINQATFRDINEWSTEATNELLRDARTFSYLCECSDGGCTEAITLSRGEYEAVRAVPVRFAIAVNHENPEDDVVVSENARFATVDKIFGVGIAIARATDPRRG